MRLGSETVQLKPERLSLLHYIGPNICDKSSKQHLECESWFDVASPLHHPLKFDSSADWKASYSSSEIAHLIENLHLQLVAVPDSFLFSVSVGHTSGGHVSQIIAKAWDSTYTRDILCRICLKGPNFCTSFYFGKRLALYFWGSEFRRSQKNLLHGTNSGQSTRLLWLLDEVVASHVMQKNLCPSLHQIQSNHMTHLAAS
jgi:hypothetical protein